MAARILVVEDNAANQQLMAYLLKAFGYTVRTAADGEEAVAAVARDAPDLILMDLHLPVMDGYQATEKIRALLQPKTIPIVAVTAFAMVGDRERILARGFDGYIPKPITPESFVHTVESYMSEPLLAGATKAAP